MKLKNKLFILLFVFIALFLVLNTNVFAAEGDFESIENFQIFDDLDWYTVKSNFNEEQIQIFNSTSIHFFYYTSSDTYYIISADILYYKEPSDGQINTLYTSGPVYVFRGSSDGDFRTDYKNLNENNLEITLSYRNSYTFIFSDENIYNIESGELVFQGPPQVEQTILAPIVEGAGAQKTLQEILKILPKILVVLVSYLGLRKALKMLSALLHRS